MAGTQIITTDDMSTSFPFNAEGDPLTGYDRVWDAADFAEYFALFIGNGIYPNPSTSLQVTSKYGNMVVTLQKGTAFINGYGFILKEDIDITLEKAHSANRRIDTISIRWDVIERKIYPVYKIGDPAASPKALPIIRNADCYELYLANIEVPARATSITIANIKDLRDEKEVCGKVLILGTELDTTTIYQQYEAYLHEKVIEWQARQNEILDLSNAILAGNWSKVDLEFDSIASRRGCVRDTVFLADGNIRETISFIAGGAMLAEKLTEFLANGDIKDYIQFYASERQEGGNEYITINFSVEKHTEFLTDGNIRETIR